VTFARSDEEAKTKEDKTEYTKPGVEGTIYPVDGTYKETVITDTVEEAVAVLKALFGGTAEAKELRTVAISSCVFSFASPISFFSNTSNDPC